MCTDLVVRTVHTRIKMSTQLYLRALKFIGKQFLGKSCYSISMETVMLMYVIVTKKITSEEKTFYPFIEWLAAHKARRSNSVKVRKQSLLPDLEIHFIRYEGSIIQVKREADVSQKELRTGSPIGTITLTTL